MPLRTVNVHCTCKYSRLANYSIRLLLGAFETPFEDTENRNKHIFADY